MSASFIGKSLISTRSFSTRKSGSAAVVNYTKQHSDLTTKWLNRLRMTATTHDGREKLGQIQNILEFFNKPSQNQGLKDISWDQW